MGSSGVFWRFGFPSMLLFVIHCKSFLNETMALVVVGDKILTVSKFRMEFVKVVLLVRLCLFCILVWWWINGGILAGVTF